MHHVFGIGFALLLSQVPIQTKMIENSLLTASERQWLNEYHAACRAKLSPHLTGEALEWLTRATEPINA